MSFHIECPHCGVVVGVLPVVVDAIIGAEDHRRLVEFVARELQYNILDCNNHKVTETKTKHLFGLLEQTLVVYHETDTTSLSFDYCGPPSKLKLWFALLFCGSDGISVNGEPAWWDFKTGFFGPGVAELANLQKHA